MDDEIIAGGISGAAEAGPGMGMFLASSVHDMKNSISILIGGLERALAELSPEVFSGYHDMAQMTYEAKRINCNLIQLLTVYKVGQNLYPFDPVPQSIDEFAMGIYYQQANLLQSHGVKLQMEYDKDLYWQFDGDLVAGVVSHALNNSMRYSRGEVRLSVHEIDGVLEIRIEDNGTGYPAGMIEDGAAAMRGVSFSMGSTGLGLYFSAMVARMHHIMDRTGVIVLENGGSLGGACFVLRLP